MKRGKVDWDEIGRESLRINKMRAAVDKWLSEFADVNGYAPTRIWTPIYPAEWESGEQWIGLHCARPGNILSDYACVS